MFVIVMYDLMKKIVNCVGQTQCKINDPKRTKMKDLRFLIVRCSHTQLVFRIGLE